MPEFIDHAVEEVAMRKYGLLGRGSSMGNALYAIDYSNLPPEAHKTIQAIISGGPFPYPGKDGKPIDGQKFSDRFGDLPSNSTGDYREFTVITPTYDDQGVLIPIPPKKHRKKRRIVARHTGILFFTACHYERLDDHLADIADKRILTEQVDPEWRNGFYLITGLTSDMRQAIRAGLDIVRRNFP
ncbi:ribonuclease domain-containing protein [Anatilimnocola sp. NA78]|uniref:ribonuclease domain-containing protein n=1 Tax=Anatilimnocola sp. NA78 TaxID=3415683 RepID=UPI003CE55B7A